ncbi:reactive intermediate/imine deaminase [Ancylomarina subtilis]|uniref:Reactive intermediate/imine deaminase n=1 Tax=Ancylomarina subtilis TaxID=1639035 RepID=A0A4Q7VIR4_9BACT|nr:RidA family protein [Ancylomarina subtilis]RZT96051.1 reactive intermediate/imine deaminase [Ancylomarina subtilis]
MNGVIIKNSRNTENAPMCTVSTQSVAFSHYNNISAQLPIDPKTGKIVAGDITEQAKQCLENIKAIVESIDHTMTDVVRINIFLKNIMDIKLVNQVYATFFQSYFPTRTVLAVAALPMDDALVQMDALISNGEGTQPQAPCDLVKLVRNTENAPKSSVSTQTVAFSHYNHISAQLPVDPKTGNIVVGGVKEQAAQCLKNIKAIMEGIDVPFDDIVKINIHLTNLSDIEAVNEAYTTFFPDSSIARTVGYMPARSVVVAEALPMHALVQIDATVSHGDGTPPQVVEDRHGIVIKANNTDHAPICSLSTQTVAFSHYNNISAQLPVDTKTGKIVAGGAKEQAAQCLNNIKAIVESIKHNMDDVVKINIQLRNIADLDAVNEVFTTFFKGDLPARTTIGVSAIPMDALVQIDAILSNAEGTPPAK